MADFQDQNWRTLGLPHDWSIKGNFKPDNPATNSGASLPGGIGWYRKLFTIIDLQSKCRFIQFDGVNMNSTVWVNGYNLKDWHERDLSDMVIRDRNHPSIFLWSIGNEIPEKNHTKYGGAEIARELDGIIKKFDTTRYTTSAYHQALELLTFAVFQKMSFISIKVNGQTSLYFTFCLIGTGKRDN